jgi:hypothetical protein
MLNFLFQFILKFDNLKIVNKWMNLNRKKMNIYILNIMLRFQIKQWGEKEYSFNYKKCYKIIFLKTCFFF